MARAKPQYQEGPGINYGQQVKPNVGLVRLSFAYLYQVEIDDQYLLIYNDNEEAPKYQPIGGAYQCPDRTFKYLQENYRLRSGQRAKSAQRARDYEAPGQHDYRFLLPLVEVRPFLFDFLLGDSFRYYDEEDLPELKRLWQLYDSCGQYSPQRLLNEEVEEAWEQLVACGIEHRSWSKQLSKVAKSWPYSQDYAALGLRDPVRSYDEIKTLAQREQINGFYSTKRELYEELSATELFLPGELEEMESDDWDWRWEYLGRSYSVAFDQGFKCPTLMLTDCLRVNLDHTDNNNLRALVKKALWRQGDPEYRDTFPNGFKPFRLFSADDIADTMVARDEEPSLYFYAPSCADHCRFILPDAPLYYPASM